MFFLVFSLYTSIFTLSVLCLVSCVTYCKTCDSFLYAIAFVRGLSEVKNCGCVRGGFEKTQDTRHKTFFKSGGLEALMYKNSVNTIGRMQGSLALEIGLLAN